MESRKPAWWQLYLLFPIMFALLLLEQLFPLPQVSVKIADIVIIVSTFAAILIWIRANEGLLERQMAEGDASLLDLNITVYDPAEQAKGNEEPTSDCIPSVWSPSALRAGRGQLAHEKESAKWFLN